MYLYEKQTGLAARVQASEPVMFGGCLATPEQAAEVARLEIWCTSFEDPGQDYCVVKLFREGEEQPFIEQRIEGY